MFAIKKKVSNQYITLAGYEGMMFLGMNQSDPVINFRNRKDAEQIHDLIDHPEQFDVTTEDNTYTLDRKYHKFGVSSDWEIVELGQVSKMELIKAIEELEIGKEYWVRLKDEPEKGSTGVLCVAKHPISLLFGKHLHFHEKIRGECYEAGRCIKDWFDIIGPVEVPDFDIYLNQHKENK